MNVNILLCCAVGMSTSLLVTRMKKTAHQLGMEGKIWAVPGDAVMHHIHDADVLLLGPQVRYLLPELKELGLENGIPVEVINIVDYGKLDGIAVLKYAKKLVGENG